MRPMPANSIQPNQIIACIADDNPDAAERVADYIYGAVAQLCEQPGLGHPGRKAGTRELLIRPGSWVSGYIIPYRVRREYVEVLAMIDSARQWPADLD